MILARDEVFRPGPGPRNHGPPLRYTYSRYVDQYISNQYVSSVQKMKHRSARPCVRGSDFVARVS